ncbi:MAG: aspartate 1-decarboxylase [Candidatus Cloacimonadia bacterium]
MLRTILVAKIHRATVTKCDLNYIGSISIDKEIIEEAGILENERVEVFDIDNGNRFSTYVIAAAGGSKEIGINGAAARLVHPGDRLIILSYGHMEAKEAQAHQAKIVVLNEKNEIISAMEK